MNLWNVFFCASYFSIENEESDRLTLIIWIWTHFSSVSLGTPLDLDLKAFTTSLFRHKNELCIRIRYRLYIFVPVSDKIGATHAFSFIYVLVTHKFGFEFMNMSLPSKYLVLWRRVSESEVRIYLFTYSSTKITTVFKIECYWIYMMDLTFLHFHLHPQSPYEHPLISIWRLLLHPCWMTNLLYLKKCRILFAWNLQNRI